MSTRSTQSRNIYRGVGGVGGGVSRYVYILASASEAEFLLGVCGIPRAAEDASLCTNLKVKFWLRLLD